MKVHGSHRLRPREIHVLPQPFWRSDSILQSSLVEHVGREFGKARMHSVLNLESDRSVPEEDQAFEEGLVQSCFRSFLVHDGWTELRVIYTSREGET